MSETQQAIQEILRLLYSSDDEGLELVERIEGLAPEQRELLISELDWFGRLALAPEGGDEESREAVLGSASRVAMAMIGAVALAILAGLAGAVGLVLLAIGTVKGRVEGGIRPTEVHHGIYAETFAVWMALFLLLQLAAGLGAVLVPGAALLLSLLAFGSSLIALAWPGFRGVPFSDVKRDVGLNLGARPSLEPLVGAGGYLMALPILAVGVGMTLVLMLIQGALAAAPEPFTAAGGPAHPIVLELPGSPWWTKLSVFLLASVAAPIVEETMFRGVLYRHLRDATRRHGRVVSVIAAASINAFLFAAIHPQGWVAIPALMALAYAFILLREWRGTLVPAMIAHGVSNGLVMTLLLTLLAS
jgi:membrane protease YdiL (CAAX protease family)